MSALIVEAGGDRFAIPQLAVVELVRARANSEHRIERIKDTPVLRLRNKLLPLMHLKSGRAFSAVGVDAWSSAQACPSQHWVGAQHSAWEVALVFDTFIGALLKVVLSSPPVGSHFSLKEQ